MAVPWSALFSAIPWTDVIAKAPDLAQGARRLWQKVGRRDATPPPDVAPATAAAIPAEALIAELEDRLAELAARQQESTHLLAELAEQNAGLVRATEELRRRLRALGIGLAIALLTALGALVHTLLG